MHLDKNPGLIYQTTAQIKVICYCLDCNYFVKLEVIVNG